MICTSLCSLITSHKNHSTPYNILRHANDAEDHQLSAPDELLGNIDVPKGTSVAGEDAQQMRMDLVGAFDVPVSEIVKKRRRSKPCDDDTTSIIETPTKMMLRKRATEASEPLSTRSENRGLISNSTVRKRKASPSLDNDLVSIDPQTPDNCTIDESPDTKISDQISPNKTGKKAKPARKGNVSQMPSGNWVSVVPNCSHICFLLV